MILEVDHKQLYDKYMFLMLILGLIRLGIGYNSPAEWG